MILNSWEELQYLLDAEQRWLEIQPAKHRPCFELRFWKEFWQVVARQFDQLEKYKQAGISRRALELAEQYCKAVEAADKPDAISELVLLAKETGKLLDREILKISPRLAIPTERLKTIQGALLSSTDFSLPGRRRPDSLQIENRRTQIVDRYSFGIYPFHN